MKKNAETLKKKTGTETLVETQVFLFHTYLVIHGVNLTLKNSSKLFTMLLCSRDKWH